MFYNVTVLDRFGRPFLLNGKALALRQLADAVRRFDQLQIRLQARYPGWWFDVGGSITRLDGNLNTVVGQDIRGFFFETTTGQRMLVQPRGSYTYPKHLTVDLHLERQVSFGRTDLVMAVDGFNLLGANTVRNRQRILTQ